VRTIYVKPFETNLLSSGCRRASSSFVEFKSSDIAMVFYAGGQKV